MVSVHAMETQNLVRSVRSNSLSELRKSIETNGWHDSLVFFEQFLLINSIKNNDIDDCYGDLGW